jgi:hypothetical protein
LYDDPLIHLPDQRPAAALYRAACLLVGSTPCPLHASMNSADLMVFAAVLSGTVTGGANGM